MELFLCYIRAKQFFYYDHKKLLCLPARAVFRQMSVLKKRSKIATESIPFKKIKHIQVETAEQETHDLYDTSTAACSSKAQRTPENWQEIFKAIQKMRSDTVAPVDTMGLFC